MKKLKIIRVTYLFFDDKYKLPEFDIPQAPKFIMFEFCFDIPSVPNFILFEICLGAPQAPNPL